MQKTLENYTINHYSSSNVLNFQSAAPILVWKV